MKLYKKSFKGIALAAFSVLALSGIIELIALRNYSEGDF